MEKNPKESVLNVIFASFTVGLAGTIVLIVLSLFIFGFSAIDKLFFPYFYVSVVVIAALSFKFVRNKMTK